MDTPRLEEEEPIKLRVSNQKAYLWDLNDIQRLRVQHHICGSLQGTLPQVSQQNVFLGLPLVLAPEEVVLLVKNRIAVIVDERSAYDSPTLAQSNSYSESRSKAIEHQQRSTYEYEEKKRIEMQEKHRDKIELKRKLKLEKQRKQLELAENEEGFQVFVPALKPGEETTGSPIASTSQQPPDLSSIAYTILIDTTSSSYPWYNPSTTSSSNRAPSVHTTLESAAQANVWNYPSNRLQTSRCLVFEDLWRKGYYMGGGLRFGGDFLVYPGDPLRYHSHFTLTMLSSPVTTIMPLDLVAYGRLATAVKKAHLLSSWNEEGGEDGKGKAEYLSLEWAAFG
ncbi:tRNA splicing endonuclease subunit SEN34 [Sporobolomyces salmoneus]|uniref:tRNA splicing endonuclease subunit SEN34 n=1 Tax=Sporobolomyces salmoneus TaxID=183962 RepID=UPI0031764AD2